MTTRFNFRGRHGPLLPHNPSGRFQGDTLIPYAFARRFATILALLAVGACGPIPEEKPEPAGAASEAHANVPASFKRNASGGVRDTGDFVVQYEETENEDYLELEAVFREIRLLEDTVKELNREFALPTDVPVVFRECGEVNAFYDPEAGEISLCYELVEHYSEISWRTRRRTRSRRRPTSRWPAPPVHLLPRDGARPDRHLRPAGHRQGGGRGRPARHDDPSGRGRGGGGRGARRRQLVLRREDGEGRGRGRTTSPSGTSTRSTSSASTTSSAGSTARIPRATSISWTTRPCPPTAPSGVRPSTIGCPGAGRRCWPRT